MERILYTFAGLPGSGGFKQCEAVSIVYLSTNSPEHIQPLSKTILTTSGVSRSGFPLIKAFELEIQAKTKIEKIRCDFIKIITPGLSSECNSMRLSVTIDEGTNYPEGRKIFFDDVNFTSRLEYKRYVTVV